ncbi:MAG: helix-turn-helix domain-containing protein [Chloroflexota bacterium]
MDPVRLGLSLRALRIRRRLTQSQVASAVGVSRATIARVERGDAEELTLRMLIRVTGALGARLDVRVLWHGEALDRLLDKAHADLTEAVLNILVDDDWDVATEVSFNRRGDRGVIDILAFHAPTRSLLVIEIKSVVPDLGAMLGTLDRKVRVAAEVARDRGWHVRTVSRLLVLPADRTARRRVAMQAAVFDAALPARTAAVRRWIKRPARVLAGVLFLPHVHQASTRHRVASRNGSPTHGPQSQT